MKLKSIFTPRDRQIFALFLTFLAMPVGMFVAALLREYLCIDPTGPYIMIFSYSVMFIFMAVVVFLIRYFLCPISVDSLKKGGFNAIYVLWGLILLISWNITISPAAKYLPSIGNEQLDQILSTGLLSVITSIVIAPFFEEWYFRGVFLRSLKEIHGSSFIAVLISAALFGLSHVYPLQSVTAFGAGIILGLIYLRTFSLWTVGTTHMLYNGLIYMLYCFNPNEDTLSPSLYVWIISLSFVLISLIFLIDFRKQKIVVEKCKKIVGKTIDHKV